MRRLTQSLLVATALIAAACASPPPASPPSPAAPAIDASMPSGTVSFSSNAVALGVGYSWGNGVLNFQGVDYPFSVSGLSIADVGVTTASGAGSVYNLAAVEDFPGTYTAASVGATVAGGANITQMQNDRGVVIRFDERTMGLGLQLAAEGVTITMP
jgi:hypothetical protein